MSRNKRREVSLGIGSRIRGIRAAKGTTLTEIARRAGLTPAGLSHIERDVTNPSVGTLKLIADALGITLGSLFDSPRPPGPVVVRPNERKLLSPCPGITYYLLTPNLDKRIQFILSEYQPGASSGELQYTHEGQECGIVLAGVLELHLGDKTYVVKKGESVSFDCGIPHCLRNPGRRMLRCIWAVSPPSF